MSIDFRISVLRSRICAKMAYGRGSFELFCFAPKSYYNIRIPIYFSNINHTLLNSVVLMHVRNLVSRDKRDPSKWSSRGPFDAGRTCQPCTHQFSQFFHWLREANIGLHTVDTRTPEVWDKLKDINLPSLL
ncbi:uncharacterized protein H6S33_010919 [Morchella sextelata]|uniref:uncharacterized protein n=1 Tax=Morchella sextelata TaxID=1174677 RepID=UPI001D038683|nr:uncharacterized protein H6S33_010919 [Morchella sextelata]KAH0611654.1 hypothetical protein H6S33_010919 [Morchella sextelata]